MMVAQLVVLLLIVTFYFDNMFDWFVDKYAPMDGAHIAVRIGFDVIKLAISFFVAYFLVIMFAITFVSIYL